MLIEFIRKKQKERQDLMRSVITCRNWILQKAKPNFLLDQLRREEFLTDKKSVSYDILGDAHCCSQRSDTFLDAWQCYLRYLGYDRFTLLYGFYFTSCCHCTRSLLVDNEL